MRLVPLGTNGFFPSFGRQTMSFLVLEGGEALVLDAGTGLGRLVEPGVRELLRGRESLHLLLSHYHLDHTVGLSYLPGVWEGRVRLYAPGPPLVDARPGEALPRLIGPPLFGTPLEEMDVEVVELDGSPLEIGNLNLRLRRNDHPGGSAAVRIDDRLAYVTDARIDDESAAFVEGAELLLHDVWVTGEEARRSPPVGHASAGEVGTLAASARVRRLMPVHHLPQRPSQDLVGILAELERAAGPEVEVVLPAEGRVYEVGGPPEGD